ncbi:MAG: DUF2125 domain-containing protein, partial [Pseudomonadota bacterium]
GISVQYTARSIHGFPFRLEARYSDPIVKFSAPQLSFAIEAKQMVLIRQLLRDDLSLLYFEAPRFAASLEGPLPDGQTGELSMVWQAPVMQTSLRSRSGSLARLSSVIDQPSGETNLASIGAFTAQQMQFHTNWPDSGHVILNSQATDLALKDADTGPLPPLIKKVQVGSTLYAERRYPLEPIGLSAWSQDGGTAELTQFDVNWGDVRIGDARGTIKLDEALALKGQLQVSVTGLPALTYAIDKTDVLGPQEDFALITLRLSRAGSTAETAVPLMFEINDGLVLLGPAPLVRLGPVARLGSEPR